MSCIRETAEREREEAKGGVKIRKRSGRSCLIFRVLPTAVCFTWLTCGCVAMPRCHGGGGGGSVWQAGYAPLHKAAHGGQVECARLLCERKANVDLADKVWSGVRWDARDRQEKTKGGEEYAGGGGGEVFLFDQSVQV